MAAALSLAEREIEVELFEQAAEVRELGVGINLLPHTVKELAELGLLEQLDATGVRTRELIYCNQLGQRIWAEPRGSRRATPGPNSRSIAVVCRAYFFGPCGNGSVTTGSASGIGWSTSSRMTRR